MRMNRRNVLFVLGTTILLGGALIASGAFSQVEATRDVTVKTTGDASAALGIAINDEYNPTQQSSNVVYTNSSSDGSIGIGFNDLNDNATIYYDNVLNISNNGDSGPIDVNVNASGSSPITIYNDSERDTVSSGNTATISGLSNGDPPGSVGIAINTTEMEATEETITITIEATQS